MGILNVTPDSFSDGGAYADAPAAAAAAFAMHAAGADIIDIGGESTRPGAQPVPPDEQIARVVPAIRAIRADAAAGTRLLITIDTASAHVAQAALDAGADAINDVSAGEADPAMLPLAARLSRGIVLMHRLAPPSADRYSDQHAATPAYPGPVVHVVARYLAARAAAALAAGIPARGIVLDPGLGFGKSVEQNLELIRGTKRLTALGYPVLSAASRKSFVGRVSLGRDSTPAERVPGSVAFSIAHLLYGALIFRVHDCPQHVPALRAAWALLPTPNALPNPRPA